jgi:hypothetical protein
MASLECTKGNQQPVTANAEVGPEESRRLTALVENPALWSGQAIGTDKRRSDGVFERIEVRARETFGTVVTSGNPSFSTDPVRREFLTLLTTIEGQLRSSTPALR